MIYNEEDNLALKAEHSPLTGTYLKLS